MTLFQLNSCISIIFFFLRFFILLQTQQTSFNGTNANCHITSANTVNKERHEMIKSTNGT